MTHDYGSALALLYVSFAARQALRPMHDGLRGRSWGAEVQRQLVYSAAVVVYSCGAKTEARMHRTAAVSCRAAHTIVALRAGCLMMTCESRYDRLPCLYDYHVPYRISTRRALIMHYLYTYTSIYNAQHCRKYPTKGVHPPTSVQIPHSEKKPNGNSSAKAEMHPWAMRHGWGVSEIFGFSQ